MSWSDLERLEADAETSLALHHFLHPCHSHQELLHAVPQLGYQLTRAVLQNAWLEHHNAREVQGADKASNY